MPGKVDEDLGDHSGCGGNFVVGLRTAGHAAYRGNRFLMLPLNTLAKPECLPKTNPTPGYSAFQSKGNGYTRSADHFSGLYYCSIRILFSRSALFSSSEKKRDFFSKWFSVRGITGMNGSLALWRKKIITYIFRYNSSVWHLYKDVKFLTDLQTGTKEDIFFVSRAKISCINRMGFKHVKVSGISLTTAGRYGGFQSVAQCMIQPAYIGMRDSITNVI